MDGHKGFQVDHDGFSIIQPWYMLSRLFETFKRSKMDDGHKGFDHDGFSLAFQPWYILSRLLKMENVQTFWDPEAQTNGRSPNVFVY